MLRAHGKNGRVTVETSIAKVRYDKGEKCEGIDTVGMEVLADISRAALTLDKPARHFVLSALQSVVYPRKYPQ